MGMGNVRKTHFLLFSNIVNINVMTFPNKMNVFVN